MAARKTPLQLGRAVTIPKSPEKAVLDAVSNPHTDADYVVRFTAPEFTTLCPITGQPDFAHFVIDYVPGRKLLESKSLKLYLASFRNMAAFHEDCTVNIGKRVVAAIRPKYLRIARFLVSAGRHTDRRLLADGQAPERRLAARPRGRALSRPGLEKSHGDLPRRWQRHAPGVGQYPADGTWSAGPARPRRRKQMRRRVERTSRRRHA